MRSVSISVPRLPEGTIPNLLGLAALIGIAVCVGGFLAANEVTGAWWVTGALGGIFALALAWLNSPREPEPASDAQRLLHAVPAEPGASRKPKGA